MAKKDIKEVTVLIEKISGKIYLIRGQKVMLDRDLAELNGVETALLKRAVRRITLSRQLQVVYGRGFSAKNLRHMIRFAEVFADEDLHSAQEHAIHPRRSQTKLTSYQSSAIIQKAHKNSPNM